MRKGMNRHATVVSVLVSMSSAISRSRQAPCLVKVSSLSAGVGGKLSGVFMSAQWEEYAFFPAAGDLEVRPAAEDRHRRALLLFRSDERAGQRRPARGRWPPQQSGGEFAPAVSTTRTSDAAVSNYEDAAEVQLSSRPGPRPFQSGAPSRHPPSVQAETLCRIGGVARPCSVDRRSREGMSHYASTTPRYFENAVTMAAPARRKQVVAVPSERGCESSRRAMRRYCLNWMNATQRP